MQQRIRVAGIVKRGGEVLLMKRTQGRSEEPAFWELPTGKIQFGEQPEEAISRAMHEYVGVKVKSLHLLDAVTFVALEGSSQLNNLYIIYALELPEKARLEPVERYSAYKFVNLDELASLRINEASRAVLEIEEGRNRGERGSYRGVASGATVFVDGASRGNPGPSAIGYYIVSEDGQVLKRGGEFIGFATSRLAEYYALREGVRQALALGLKSVRFVGDNLMMINQMNGVYKIKNRDILPIYQEIQGMLVGFEACAFTHRNREQNMEADREANLAIERHFER